MAKLQIIGKLLLKPNENWDYISLWDLSVTKLFGRILLPFALIAGVADFWGRRYTGIIQDLDVSIVGGVAEFIALFIAILITSWAVSNISANYGQKKDYNTILKLVVFSGLPVYIGLILSHLHFTMEIFKMLGLYSAYVFWFGCIELLETKEEKRVGFGVIFGLLLLCSFYVTKFLISYLLLKI